MTLEKSLATDKVNSEELDRRKAGLRDYFGGNGFERWRIIYGDGPVSFIRQTVREGHAQMVAQTLSWIGETSEVKRILDAGCGPGLVALELARKGYDVTGCDLSEQMVASARDEALKQPAEVSQHLNFVCSDLETVGQQVKGAFDLVLSLDVLIYYPEDELERIISRLAQSFAPQRIIFTYAPSSLLLRTMHLVGRRFPRTQRATSLEIIGPKRVRQALQGAGFKLTRQRHFNKGFYHVVLAEAVR